MVYEGDQHRYQDRVGYIDQDGIGGDIAHIAAQFAGDHRRCRGRGAYQAQHGSLQHHSQAAVGQNDKHYAYGREEAALYKNKPQMPWSESQMPGIDAAEGEQEHCENKQRLEYAHRMVGKAVGELQSWNGGIDKIAGHACQHGYN